MAWRQVTKALAGAKAAPTAASIADITAFDFEVASRLLISVEQDPEGTTWNGTVQVWARRAGSAGRWTQVEVSPFATGADSNSVSVGLYYFEGSGMEFYIQHTPNGAPTGSVSVWVSLVRS